MNATGSELLQYLRTLAAGQANDACSDRQLLEQFVTRREQVSFAALLRRHGPMVLGVCRRVLGREEDAEDAFQATFLVLARKAGSIRKHASLGSWLHGVAYHVAEKLRSKAARRTIHERKAAGRAPLDPAEDVAWREVRCLLDSELARLPEQLRGPLVLCYLEGKSNAEAARELDCRLGTIYSRLSRGRELLRQRLQHRGMTLPAAALTVVLTGRAVEAAPAISLVRAAARAALAFADPSAAAAVPPRVAELAEGVLKTMFVTKLKIAAVMLLVIGVAAGGVWTQARTAAPQARSASEETPPKSKDGDKKDAKRVPVAVAKPEKGGLARTVNRQARVMAAQQQQLVPLISGTVKEVFVDIGDRVKKGQVLIVLDAPLLAKEVEEAAAALELAQAQIDAAKEAFEMEQAKVHAGNAKADVAKVVQARAAQKSAEARRKLAKAALDKARIQESFTQLKAAFDGVVTRRTADPGNFVQASDSRLLTPLLTLQRTDQVRVKVQVPDQYASLISLGDPVNLTLDALPGARITGQKIARFSPVLDVTENTVFAEIDVPNREGRLMPGMYGRITIHFKKRLANALVVPSSCVFGIMSPDTSVRHVYIVRDGTAYLTQIKMTAETQDGKNMEIVGDVNASDLIVTDAEKLSGEPG